MNKLLPAIWLGLGPLPAQAQVLVPASSDTTYWRTSLKAGMNLNEAVISDNWKGGGATSLGVSTLFNGQAHYLRGHHSWDNEASASTSPLRLRCTGC